MKISAVIKALNEIKAEFGDLPIVGGYLSDDSPPRKFIVVESDGMEIFPHNPNGLDLKKVKVAGIFIIG